MVIRRRGSSEVGRETELGSVFTKFPETDQKQIYRQSRARSKLQRTE